MNKPLDGVRVLDLTHMLSGPYGGMILADLGAETIKVEPLQGEGTRKLLATDPDNALDGMGAYFITLNRNKQSVAIDLKSAHRCHLWSRAIVQVKTTVMPAGGPTAAAGVDCARENAEGLEEVHG